MVIEVLIIYFISLINFIPIIIRNQIQIRNHQIPKYYYIILVHRNIITFYLFYYNIRYINYIYGNKKYIFYYILFNNKKQSFMPN